MNFINEENRFPEIPKLCRMDTMDHHEYNDSIEDEYMHEDYTAEDRAEFRPDEINVAKNIMEELGRASPPIAIDYKPEDDDSMFYAPGKLTIDINSILKNTKDELEKKNFININIINTFYKDTTNDYENSVLNVDLLPDIKDTPQLKRETYEFLPWYHSTKESWVNYVMTHGKDGILYTKVGALTVDSWNSDHLDVLFN